ncbi:MAG: amidohydrolase family protein [Symbiobacteriaceae bacterium]|nr:amidohydrolase family protein [Symbiobacteriaceae bacterium]
MLLIQNGNLHLPGGELLIGQDILCENGLIARIAPEITAEASTIIDAKGKDVFPGLILPVCSIGAYGFAERTKDHQETTEPVTPQLDILASLDIREVKLQHFTRSCITSYGLSPGDSTLLAGSMALIHSDGPNAKELVIVDKVALKGNFTQEVKGLFGASRRMPYSRMGMFHLMDDAFRAAKAYQAEREKEESSKAYDAKYEALLPVLRREIPLVVNAYIQREIEAMAELAVKYGIRVVIHGAYQIDRCAERVMAAGCQVALGDLALYHHAVNFETDYSRIVELYRQGLKLSLACNADMPGLAGYDSVFWSAALLQRHGATPAEVLDMLTVNTAEALGVSHLVGTITTGRQADLFICQGNPLERFDVAAEYTLIKGEVVYCREVA